MKRFKVMRGKVHLNYICCTTLTHLLTNIRDVSLGDEYSMCTAYKDNIYVFLYIFLKSFE